MKISRKTGTTNEITQVFIRDSTSTTGAGLTGLVFNSAGLTAYYKRNDQNAAVAITLVTATLGTYTSGGFKEIDATNMPGWYELHLPAGVFTSGRSAAIHLKGATNMAPLPIEVELTAVDNQDSAAGGLSSITGIKAKTDSLAFTVAGQVDANIQYVNDTQVNGNGSVATPWGP